VDEALVKRMEKGSVIVDVAVDQGGCISTIHPTTHADPTYTLHGVIHYGVANMPGAVPRTSTIALANTTVPYIERIAAWGVEEAVRRDPALALGANVWRGRIVHAGVAESLGVPCTPLAWDR
jgi:alanine dehydrogenase